MVLEVCWSGVLEREGKAPGLASPVIPTTAAAAMRQAGNFSDLTIKLPPPKPKFCLKCGKQEQRKPCNGKGEFGPFGKTCKGCRSQVKGENK